MKILIFTPVRLFGEALTRSLSEFAEVEVVDKCHAADQVDDRVLEFQSDRMLLRCSACGHQTTGWEMGNRPVPRRSNDRNDPVTRPVVFTPAPSDRLIGCSR